MSKGTTTSTGIVENYFANIFGPVQYQSLHDEIAQQYFDVFFDAGLYVASCALCWEFQGRNKEALKALRWRCWIWIRSRS
jgi:hypothetical protein